LALQRLGDGDGTASETFALDGPEPLPRFRKSFATPGRGDGLTHVRLTRRHDELEVAVVFAADPDGAALETTKPPRGISLDALRKEHPATFGAANRAVGGLLNRLPLDDGYERFAPGDSVIAPLLRAFPGGRILPVPWLFDLACSVVLQQRVSFSEARRSWCAIARTLGTSDAFGTAFPRPETMARVPSWQWRDFGVDVQRARTLSALAHEEASRPFLRPTLAFDDVRARLRSIPGIGPWTTEMILGFGAGDPDAVLVGDLHLPNLAAWAFARRPRGTDEELLGFLAAYPGQRFRVARLLIAAKMARHPLFDGFR
jgi:hypothetical protein